MRNEQATRAERWLRAYVQAVVAHPWRVLFLVALATAALSVRVGTLRVHIDVDASLPERHPYVQGDANIRALFGGRNVLAITVVPKTGTVWNAGTLATIAGITEAASRIPGIINASVLSLASPKVKDIRGTADGIEARRLMALPPADPAGIADLAAALARNEIYVDSIVTAKGDAAAIYLDFQESVSDEEVYSAVRDVVAEARTRTDDDIYLTGMAAFVYHFTAYTREVVWFFALALVVIMAILWLAFRSLQGTFLPLATALLSTFWGLGFMALTGAAMDGWNAMSPILTMAVAAGHSVQILKRFYEEYDRLGDVRAAVEESTVKIGVVMLAAGFIASASFASLMAFGIATIRVFGFFTAAGIASALVLEMTFIPACRSLLPPPPRRRARADRFAGLIQATAAAVARERPRRAILAAAALLVAAAAWAGHTIVVNNSIRAYLPPWDEARLGADAIERHFGGAVPVYLMFEGDGEGALKEPAVLERIAGLQAHLAGVPGVSKTQSVADMVKLIYRALNADDPAYDRIPPTRRMVAQCLLLYGLSGDPDDFERLVNASYTRALLRGFLANDETQLVTRVLDEVRSYLATNPLPPGIRLEIGGAGATMLAMNATMIRGKLVNIAQVGVLIYVISSVVLGSAAAGLFVLVPLVLAVAVNFGALGALGMWLNMGTATITAMAVGIGADYAIYLIYRLREELRTAPTDEVALARTLATSGKAIVFVAAAISGGYLALWLGRLEFYRMIARLVPLTMLVSAASALTVMPALLFLFRPAFMFRETVAEPPEDSAAGGSAFAVRKEVA